MRQRNDETYVRTLEEKGPCSSDELPYKSLPGAHYSRLRVRRIRLTFSTPTQVGGQTKPVYYLREHDLRGVVRKYLEINPFLLEKPKATLSGLFGRHSQDMQDAFRDIADSFDIETNDRGGSRSIEKTCPLCGEPGLKDMPSHLTKCPNR